MAPASMIKAPQKPQKSSFSFRNTAANNMNNGGSIRPAITTFVTVVFSRAKKKSPGVSADDKVVEMTKNTQSRDVSDRRFFAVQSRQKKKIMGISENSEPRTSRLAKVMTLCPLTRCASPISTRSVTTEFEAA